MPEEELLHQGQRGQDASGLGASQGAEGVLRKTGNPERKALIRKRKELVEHPLARSSARWASGTSCSEVLRQ